MTTDTLTTLRNAVMRMTPGEWSTISDTTQYTTGITYSCGKPIVGANPKPNVSIVPFRNDDATGIAALKNTITPAFLDAVFGMASALERLNEDDKLTCDNITYDIANGNCPCSGCQAQTALARFTAALKPAGNPLTCQASSDGECAWMDCPQKRDGEPLKTRRHCPLDKKEDRERL